MVQLGAVLLQVALQRLAPTLVGLPLPADKSAPAHKTEICVLCRTERLFKAAYPTTVQYKSVSTLSDTARNRL